MPEKEKPPQPTPRFKHGDVVRLKCGSPSMVIEKSHVTATPNGEGWAVLANCLWFGDTATGQVVKRESFPEHVLDVVKPEREEPVSRLTGK
jgi:uncharacterized protein YodC (DUF2158 family)